MLRALLSVALAATIRPAHGPGVDWPLPGPVSPGVVSQEGEIVVMIGDAEITSGEGISPDNLNNIVSRFYLYYPDEFDGIAVFLSFPDGSLGGAYAICGDAAVTGIGPKLGGCHPMSQRLISVVNMNSTDQYGTMTENDLEWFRYMGQEFGHSWLTFFHFVDPTTGLDSDELLGRQLAHYAAWVHADGSVMDGVSWQDNGDGTFTVTGIMDKFSKLDLYAMGIIPAEEVPPFFIIRNAHVLPGGEPLLREFGLAQLGVGTTVQGHRVDLAIDDLIAANGERRPSWDDAPEEFRQAFVLVTRPGETVADVMDRIEKLETGRLAWETRFARETQNRGFVCTNLSAPCPRAAARVVSATVAESDKDSDRDGIIEPGEKAIVTVELWNTGGADATDAVGEIRTQATSVIVPPPTPLPTIPVNARVPVTFPLSITRDACGVPIELEAAATIGSRTWKAPFSMRPGVIEGEVEPFATDAGWTVDHDFADTAETGKWAHGVPKQVIVYGKKTQPAGGAGGASDAAWCTDLSDRWDAGEVSGGQTTLTSALYDLSRLYRPTLRYQLWYVALDRTTTTIEPAPEPHLIVEASTDGGKTWVEVDRVGGGPWRWVIRETPLDAITPSAQTRFRFTAFDDKGSERLVEIGVDDVQVISLSDACRARDDGGCGCRVAGRAGARWPWVAALALLAPLLLTWTRRATRRRSRRSCAS